MRGHFCTSRHAVDYWRTEQKAGRAIDARIINTSSGAGLQGSIGQSAYSAAKAGIANLTLVQAAELARYGITANALAPNARTRMTMTAFAATMTSQQDASFDPYAPENTAPLITWLASEASRDVTGQVFEPFGGTIRICEGWTDGPTSADAGRMLSPEDVGAIVQDLAASRSPAKPVYGAG